MIELSPAAHAVITAILEISPAPADEIAAAALRAAVEHRLPEEADLPPFAPDQGHARKMERRLIRRDFLAIATELEGAS